MTAIVGAVLLAIAPPLHAAKPSLDPPGIDTRRPAGRH